MKKIAIVYSSHKEQISEYLIKVIRELLKYNLEVSVLRSGLIDLIDLKVNYENNLDDLMKNCDLVLILGGDGTIMHFAKLAARYNKYILGVNAGRIGFLSSIEINQIDKIFNIVNGNFNVDRRTMFEVSYGDKSKIILNEVSLNRNLQSRISDYEIYEKEKLVCNYRSDGVIISTPTGSTAYSFSAGGPIAHPNMNCAIITPVCPYSIFSRSLILPGDEKIILNTNVNYHEYVEQLEKILGREHQTIFEDEAKSCGVMNVYFGDERIMNLKILDIQEENLNSKEQESKSNNEDESEEEFE